MVACVCNTQIYKGHSSAEQWEGMSYRDIFSRIVETIFAVNMLDCSSVLRNPYQARHYFIFPCDKCPFGLEPLRLGAFRQSNTSILVSWRLITYVSLCISWIIMIFYNVCCFVLNCFFRRLRRRNVLKFSLRCGGFHRSSTWGMCQHSLHCVCLCGNFMNCLDLKLSTYELWFYET